MGGAEQVEISIDGGVWQNCRLTSGYWWYDWSAIRPGRHTLVARMRTPDGQSGYVWKDHLRFDAAEPTAAAVVTPTTLATAPSIPASGASAPSTVVPVAELRTATVDRPDGVAVELQHLRTEVARLATAQQELTQRLAHGGHEGTSSVPISTDGSAGAAVVFFAVGIFVGWIVGRFTAGRRDRRSRIRL